MKIFTGYDDRESIGWHVFAQSVIDTTPGAELRVLPAAQGDGSNVFTYSRFLVPQICEFKGWALSVDGVDMLAYRNLNGLVRYANSKYAVLVVKHHYQTRNPRKYVGTEMECANEDYPCKNWSSVILWNCAHPAHRLLSEINRTDPMLHRFVWLSENEIGGMPLACNWLADEYGEIDDAYILHWTAGIPGFAAHADAPMAEHWHRQARKFMPNV